MSREDNNTSRYNNLVPPPNTPLPRQIARETARMAADLHQCLHSDAEILFEDVRQARKRRWWLMTTVAVAVIGSIIGLAAWIYSVGEGVGTAKSELIYLQRAEETDRVQIGTNDLAIRQMERDQVSRYSEIEQMLIRLDARLENIEAAVGVRTTKRTR